MNIYLLISELLSKYTHIQRQSEVRIKTYEQNKHASDEIVYSRCPVAVSEHIGRPIDEHDEGTAYIRT